VPLGQETAAKRTLVPPAGLGLLTFDQCAPSQRSISVLLPDPTAKQVAVLAHDTPFKLAWEGPGALTIDQCVPFQCSTKGPLPELPTAKHRVAVGHDAALRREPDGLGAATIDQCAPFHRSMNARNAELVWYLPTAKHRMALGHATPESVTVNVAAGGVGTGIADHLDPFQW